MWETSTSTVSNAPVISRDRPEGKESSSITLGFRGRRIAKPSSKAVYGHSGRKDYWTLDPMPVMIGGGTQSQ